jgi:cysteine desulfuration protein SufE
MTIETDPNHANYFDHHFGRDITLEQLAQTLDAAASWEAKNRLLVQLAKQLPDWPAEAKTAEKKVAGCESQVWLDFCQQDNHWLIAADSDSRIVKGLLALTLTAFNHREGAQVAQFDFEAWLQQRGMQRFLSASRGNGLRAITQQIKQHFTQN